MVPADAALVGHRSGREAIGALPVTSGHMTGTPPPDLLPTTAEREPSGRAIRLAVERVADALAAADPGFTRLRVATRTALSIALALVGEWAFVGTTGALQSPTPPHASAHQLAAVAAQHHDVLVVAMLLGGVVANLAGLNANEPTARARFLTLAYIPTATIAALTLGLAIGRNRTAALVVMVVVLVIGAYGRRFGQRGAVTGVVVFLGYFYGFFLTSSLGIGAAGWLACEILIGAGAVVAVRALLFRASATADLRRALRTYRARAAKVLALALALFDDPAPRRRKALQRWLVRLDEAALIVEGQLALPGAAGPLSAAALRRDIFDLEVAITNVARYVDMLSTVEPDPERRQPVRLAIAALAAGRPQEARRAVAELRARIGMAPPPGTEGPTRSGRGAHPVGIVAAAEQEGAPSGAMDPSPAADEMTHWVIAHRLANAVDALAGALARWRATDIGAPAPTMAPAVGAIAAATSTGPLTADGATTVTGGSDGASFQPAVTLRGGWLPGSADVSGEASALPTRRVQIAPYVRTTAQMAVAVTIAIVSGDALDSQHFYWAVIAALLALVGTNTVAEQLRKATHRVVGTLAGVVVGTALVNLVGRHSVWSLVVVVGVMWIGVYFFRVNYALMAMAVTISLSQAYVSLGQFSNGLLWERLAETAVGAGAAMLAVVVVLPLRTRRVVDVAMAGVVDGVAALADGAAAILEGDESVPDLRQTGRQVDAAFQALVATAEPLRMVAWSDSADRMTRQLGALTAARNYARNLVSDVQGPVEALRGQLSDGRAVLRASARELAARLRGERRSGPYVRAAALFAGAEAALTEDGSETAHPSVLALRDLVLVDNALADLALSSGMPVERLPAALVADRAHPWAARGAVTDPAERG